jgi:hypothetical protein
MPATVPVLVGVIVSHRATIAILTAFHTVKTAEM